MHRRFSTISYDKTNGFLQAGLCLVWAAGLSLGFLAETFHGDALCACVRLSAARVPDLAGCLSVSVLPLLISACAVYFFSFAVIPVCFLRGMVVGLGLWAVGSVFGAAKVWMACLCLFGLVASSWVLMWFCLRRIVYGGRFFAADTCAAVAAGFAISGLDMAVVSPFLAEIMNF